ncbi:MAG: hypothetical protein ABIJ34_00660 [archaeon]
MLKKGQEQIQFNWIYIAVVGAVILLVFINIASGIRKSSKTKLEIDAITYFDEIFTSVQASENTENSITLAGLELEVASDADDCNRYTIKGSDLGGRSTEFVPLFGPNYIKKKILSYSLGWDMPFRVNYFLFLTSPEIAYVSIGNNAIFGELPEHLTKEKVARADDFVNQNYYKVRFFTTNEDMLSSVDASLRKLNDEDVSAVYVNEGLKTVKYYQKKDGSFEELGETYYLDQTSMLAAIYTENLGAYECNMKKSIRRLNKFSAILKERVKTIQSSNLMPLCISSAYQEAEGMLSELESATDTPEISRAAFSKISSIKERLTALNKELNKKSCPTVY